MVKVSNSLLPALETLGSKPYLFNRLLVNYDRSDAVLFAFDLIRND